MLASRIHKDLLLKVMKVADVFEFTIAKTGDKPVDMVSVDGKKYKLTISELTGNFTTLQGKPIRIIRLNKNKQYLATKLQSTPCFAVKVPRGSNKQIEMPDGQVVGPGKVIVIHADKLVINGDFVDVSNGTVMTEAFFRKTCVLKEISETFKKQLVSKGVLKDENIATITPDLTTAAPITETPVQTVQPVPQPVTPQPVTPQPTPGVEGGKIVSVIKTTGSNSPVGYNVMIQGQVIPLDVANTMQACAEGLITNATVVSNANGTTFLRGIGIKLEELPVDYR